ncbi:MAG: NAD-dependent epimerase/dehydratase family protein, partial [Candidatus Marsarchaeota archaeon]|nr:NAD-dependent epimerase/dehydratase family protein [Candidatus Marsarchaeota archaeon]
VLAGQGVDALVHLAWVFDPIHDEEAAHRINIGGTRNVLRVCEELRINKIVYPGSTTAYGAHSDNPVPLTEECPVRGNIDFRYSCDKAEADIILQEFQCSHPQFCVSNTRICIIVGPNIDNYLARYVTRPIVFAVKNYNPPLQFLHEDDFVDVMMELILHDHPGTYNIAGDGIVRVDDFGRIFRSRLVRLPYSIIRPLMALFWTLRVKWITEAPASLLKFIMYPWIADCSKAKRELGFQPKYTSEEALASYMAAQRRAGSS